MTIDAGKLAISISCAARIAGHGKGLRSGNCVSSREFEPKSEAWRLKLETGNCSTVCMMEGLEVLVSGKSKIMMDHTIHSLRCIAPDL